MAKKKGKKIRCIVCYTKRKKGDKFIPIQVPYKGLDKDFVNRFRLSVPDDWIFDVKHPLGEMCPVCAKGSFAAIEVGRLFPLFENITKDELRKVWERVQEVAQDGTHTEQGQILLSSLWWLISFEFVGEEEGE